MSNNTDIQKVSEAIEAAINDCGIRSIAQLPKFLQAVRMAQGIKALRDALTKEFVMATLMPLQGTALGFLTDLDSKGGYGWEVVRDCSIEAMLRGFSVVGNEFNIIAGRFYGAKAGFARQVADYPGLSNLVLQPGVPQLIADKGALVPYTASWTLGGASMRIDCQATKDGPDLRIPVKVNAGMGSDAILGKAERKMLYRIYQRLNGSSFGLVDGEVGDDPILTTGEPAPSPVPAGTPEGRRIKLRGKAKATGGTPPPAEQSHGTAAPARPQEGSPSGPAVTTADKAAAPEGPAPVDLVELHEALAQVDNGWAERGRGEVLASWTEEQRLGALTWANAVIHDGPMLIQSRRPVHTLLSMREPGEEG